MATPPYTIDESLPQSGDVISLFPGQSQDFRDTVKSIFDGIIDFTTGKLESGAFPSSITINTVVMTAGRLERDVTNSNLTLRGGTAADAADASIILEGGTHATLPGRAFIDCERLTVRNASGATEYAVLSSTQLVLGAGIDIVHENIKIDGGNIYRSDGDAGLIRISGGAAANTGANIEIYGPTHATQADDIFYDADIHTFRSVAAGNRLIINSSGLTLGSNLDITFAGTGAANTRTNLGLGTMATQNATAVNIDGGTINGITDLAVADGGTGASTAANARTNLGLGTMATQDEGTAGTQFRDNTANDARFHVSGTDTLDAGDLPTSAAAVTWVGARTATLALGAIGSYAFLRYGGASVIDAGDTVSGSLTYTNARGQTGGGSAGGTWRLMGEVQTGGGDTEQTSLFLRIS